MRPRREGCGCAGRQDRLLELSLGALALLMVVLGFVLLSATKGAVDEEPTVFDML